MPQNEQNLVEMESLQPKVENGEPDPYDLKALDKIWYPKLEKKLSNKQKLQVLNKATDYDETDHGQVMSIDDIDATGTISAKELEAELKSMHRYRNPFIFVKYNFFLNYLRIFRAVFFWRPIKYTN